LEKELARSSIKNSKNEDEKKASFQSEPSDEEVHLKKAGQLKNNGSRSSMTVEQIQDLAAKAVKAQLRGDGYKTHLYTKPYAQRVDTLCMPRGYQPPKLQQFDGKGN